MATKKFIIEVEEGKTISCEKCPFSMPFGMCNGSPVPLNCLKLDLATMKITEYNEPTCYDLQCLGRNPNKLIEYEK